MSKGKSNPNKGGTTPEQRARRIQQAFFVVLALILVVTMILSLIRF